MSTKHSAIPIPVVGHTPGPWSVEQDWTAEIHGADGSLIGKIVAPVKSADAYLIASAPELLDLVRKIAAMDNGDGGVSYGLMRPLVEEAGRLIRKAEGLPP